MGVNADVLLLVIVLLHVHTHTHTRLTALCLGLHSWAGTRKVQSIWILLKRETVSGSGISWAVCKSAPRSRQTTTPAPHRSFFYRLDALPAAQPSASKHWRHILSTHTHTHTHPFNGLLSGTTRVSRYQKGKTNLDFTGARDSEWQWHQLGMCKSAPRSRQITTPAHHHSVFYRPDALPAAQPTASKHWLTNKA